MPREDNIFYQPTAIKNAFVKDQEIAYRKCKKCGNTMNGKFCGNCGSLKFTSYTKLWTLKCSKCGQSLIGSYFEGSYHKIPRISVYITVPILFPTKNGWYLFPDQKIYSDYESPNKFCTNCGHRLMR